MPPPSPLDLLSLVLYFALHLPLNLSGLVWYSFFFASRPLRFGLVFLLFRHWASGLTLLDRLNLVRHCFFFAHGLTGLVRPWPWIFQFWFSISVIFASGPLRFDLVFHLLRLLPFVLVWHSFFLYWTPEVYSTGPFKFGLTFLLCPLRTFLDWFVIPSSFPFPVHVWFISAF